jgi:hypothetical protein
MKYLKENDTSEAEKLLFIYNVKYIILSKVIFNVAIRINSEVGIQKLFEGNIFRKLMKMASL